MRFIVRYLEGGLQSAIKVQQSIASGRTEVPPPWIAFAISALFLIVQGCSETTPPPVEIFPEDNCANCRMALSQPRFASEIITVTGAVRKFDDLSCLESYRDHNPDEKAAVTYYKDFQINRWLKGGECVIVQTSLSTPMGSGLIAVADSTAAQKIQLEYPPEGGEGGGL